MKADELNAIDGAMTEGPWTEAKPGTSAEGWPTGIAVAAVARGQLAYAEAKRGAFPAADLAGIVALRNHARAWIDLQAAVARWRDATCETESAETDDYVIAGVQGECTGDTHEDSCPVAVARRSVLAALAVVEAIP